MGGVIGMGNTCKPMAESFQCMTKIHYNIKNKNKIKKEKKEPTYVEGCTQSSWSLSLNSEKIGGN